MHTITLVWVSGSLDWDDVSLPASRCDWHEGRIVLAYRGDTEEGGYYAGEFELLDGPGMQSLEGEYTVHPPQDAPEPFTQVVSFGLSGQIKPGDDGLPYFSGIWDESGVAQAFRVGPLQAVVAGPVGTGTPLAAGESGAQAGLSTALQAYQLLLGDLASLAGWRQRLDELQALLAEAAAHSTEAGHADWLREHASARLETLLDEPPSLPGGTPAELRRLADNLGEALRRYGYPLCGQWLGLDEAAD